MNLEKFKWPFYLFTFFLVTVVAAALKKPESNVPALSEAIILVGVIYGAIYLVVKLLKRLSGVSKSNKEAQ